MLSLDALGMQIAARRAERKLTQAALAQRAKVGRSTLDALENGRLGELGLHKIGRILAVLGLELAVVETRRRPTLEELVRDDDEDLDRTR